MTSVSYCSIIHLRYSASYQWILDDECPTTTVLTLMLTPSLPNKQFKQLYLSKWNSLYVSFSTVNVSLRVTLTYNRYVTLTFDTVLLK